MGRLGSDPEFKTLNSGTSVCNFSLATRRNAEDTDWHKISVFGKAAEIVDKYVKKGDQLLVDGSVQYRSYENNDGLTVYITEIISFNIDLIASSKQESNDEPKAQPKRAAKKPVRKSAPADDDFDL